MKKVGAYSKPNRLTVLDGRTVEARLLKAAREELIRHVGGNPSQVQLALINQAATLKLRLQMMDKAAIADPDLGERTGRQYLAWSNSYCRVLKLLGFKAAKAAAPTLQDILAQPRPSA